MKAAAVLLARRAPKMAAALLGLAGLAGWAAAVAVLGVTFSELDKKELLRNGGFDLAIGGASIENWTAVEPDGKGGVELASHREGPGRTGIALSSPSGDFTLTQTIDRPFAGARHDRLVEGSFRVNVASGIVLFSIYGVTRGESRILDQKEIRGNGAWSVVHLQPRMIPRLGRPPDQFRVEISATVPPLTPVQLRSATLRANRAGVFNAFRPPMWRELIGMAFALAGANAILIWLFRVRWKALSDFRGALINTSLLLSAAVYTLLAIEAFTRLFLVFPDSTATTLVSELWWDRYWKPVNELGFRDIGHTPGSFSGKRVLFVVGDSYAAGHGIKNFQDTFSQLLADRLGPDWSVVVIAKPGLSSRDELDALKSYSVKPDLVLLAHVWNDVNSALVAHGVPLPGKPAPPRALRPILLRSYFLDFVYWRLRGFRAPASSYLELILSAYRDPAIWETHKHDLGAFTAFAANAGAPLIVGAFPALDAIDTSRETSANVVAYFRSLGVRAFDFGDVFAGANPKDITVNRFDSHPNEAAHKRIADEFFVQIGQVLAADAAPSP